MALSDLADLVRGWTRDTVIVGAEILVVKDGRAVLHEVSGWRDLEAGEPMRKNSIFRLLAMTKPFTGTAALMLVDDGLLELDAPVSRWLPSWADERSGDVTVRQLLTHTGGWEQYGTPRPLDSYPSLRAMVDNVGEHGPQHPPGRAYRYSDIHSYALGALVEEASGLPVERFIEERILEPLGLVETHTRFVPDTVWAPRVNSRYELEKGAWKKVWSPDQPQADPFFRASGGLFSTAMDYARWLKAWTGWIGASPDTTEAGAGPSKAESPKVRRLLSRRTAAAAVTAATGPYGFHWEILSDDPLVFGHGGVDGTHALAIPSLDVIVVYLTQSQDQEMRGRWTRAALDAVAPGLDLHRPLASVPAERSGLYIVELTPAQRARYAGRYRAGSLTVRIFEEGGRLQRRLPTVDALAVTLVPLGDHTFAMGRHEGDELTELVLPLQRLRFGMEDGRATSLELIHDGEVRAVLSRASEVDPWPADAPPGDTVRYIGIVNGMTGGERLLWREGPDTWAYSYDMGRSGFPRNERLTLDEEGLPLRLQITGQKAPWVAWEERFERDGDTAGWTTTVDEGERPAYGPAYYASLHPAHDAGVLARALLRQPSRSLPLLPAGEARLESLGQRTVQRTGQIRTVRHYAIHGLDLKPVYVWLDANGATFADEWTVRAGWKPVFPELKDASRAALADQVRGLAQRLMPPPRDRPITIRGARLFDPATGAVRSGTTILVEGNRIAAVGDDGDVEVPEDAEVIDAAGRTVLPGLWDMHAHHGTSLIGFFRYRELDAPLHLAGGVTTARDLGSHTDELLSLRRRLESGDAIGPRLLAAGYIDGVGGSRTGVQVGTAEEARAAVDRFAELGYVQVKIYDQLPADLVPVVIERADRHGLRVSGHVPRSMSAREAVEAGFDELQHVEIAVGGILGSRDDLSARWEDDWEGWADAQAALQPGSEAVREFIDLLVARDVAVDPTLALALASEVPPHYVAPVMDRFPPQARRRLLDRFWPRPPEVAARWDRYVSSWMGFVRAAHQAGVSVLPGTDLMSGFGLHRELELYVQAGIPAPEVLTLATLGTARAVGRDDDLGSIESGKLADLILVDGDPTADIGDVRRVVAVVKDGRVFAPAKIYRALGIEPCCKPQP